jgi:hypothetical protein
MASVSRTSGGPQVPLDASAHPYRCFCCYSLQHSINNKEPLLMLMRCPHQLVCGLSAVYPPCPL